MTEGMNKMELYEPLIMLVLYPAHVVVRDVIVIWSKKIKYNKIIINLKLQGQNENN